MGGRVFEKFHHKRRDNLFIFDTSVSWTAELCEQNTNPGIFQMHPFVPRFTCHIIFQLFCIPLFSPLLIEAPLETIMEMKLPQKN